MSIFLHRNLMQFIEGIRTIYLLFENNKSNSMENSSSAGLASENQERWFWKGAHSRKASWLSFHYIDEKIPHSKIIRHQTTCANDTPFGIKLLGLEMWLISNLLVKLLFVYTYKSSMSCLLWSFMFMDQLFLSKSIIEDL